MVSRYFYIISWSPLQAREMDLLRNKNDDAHSETSAESATSDSGRGGSEEDINSNRGHPLSDTGNKILIVTEDPFKWHK